MLEIENKELKEKLRIKEGGCRNCKDCAVYKDDPRHNKWGPECKCYSISKDECVCYYGPINAFHDIFLKDHACNWCCSKKEHGEKW